MHKEDRNILATLSVYQSCKYCRLTKYGDLSKENNPVTLFQLFPIMFCYVKRSLFHKLRVQWEELE